MYISVRQIAAICILTLITIAVDIYLWQPQEYVMFIFRATGIAAFCLIFCILASPERLHDLIYGERR